MTPPAHSASIISENDQGLSLLEVLAAASIIGILVAAGVPMYNQFTAKAKMAEGESAVFDVRNLEQQYYGNTHTYSTDLVALGYAPMPELRFYAMEVQLIDPTEPTGVHYRVVARAKVPQLHNWYLSVYGDGTEQLRHGTTD